MGTKINTNDRGFVYYIIPSPILARETKRSYKKWLATPGKHGQKHNPNPMRNAYIPPKVSHAGWSIREYEDRWDLITKKLK